MPSNLRINFLKFVFLACGFILIARLFYIQVLENKTYSAIAQSQHLVSSYTKESRGAILASDGYPLVSSSPAWSIEASLDQIENSSSLAAKLAPILADLPQEVQKDEEGQKPQKSKEEILLEEEARIKELLLKPAKWVLLKNKVSDEVKKNVEALRLKGINFSTDEKRVYPEKTLAAHILGFLGKDEGGVDKGYFGLEGYYDLLLKPTLGERFYEKDAMGRPILTGKISKMAASRGATIKTNLIRPVQFIVEKHLKDALEKYQAEGGTVIVLNPENGAVLAMASLPSYDPANFNKEEPSLYSNPAISMSFEPGSVFKVLVMAAALDSKALALEDKCPVCASSRRIAEYTISTWNDKYFPDTTPGEIIQHSDNIGMVWVGERLGADKLYDYLQDFGLGKKTGIDLQGEAEPKLRNKGDWSSIDLATASFGQGVALSPIQLVKAVAAVAAGGVVFQPQVVDSFLLGSWEEDIKPMREGRVISNETARKVSEMMVVAVDKGESSWAKPEGFSIAGKTGTAQIPLAGHYDTEKTIASFVGFAPADKPKFVMLTTLLKPQTSPWAAETAAPLWFSIAKDLFYYFGLQPEG